MIKRLKQLTQRRFVRSVLIVATGTAGAQAITMAFSPVITRLYSPETFGILGTFMAILAVLTPMSALTYPIAIVLPRKDTDAQELARLSILLAVATSSLTLMLIFIWGEALAEQLGAGAIIQYLWLIPFAMFFSALHQVAEQWLIRHRQYRITARVAVIQSAVLNSSKVGAGAFYPLAPVLIALQTATSGVHSMLLWLYILKNKPLHLLNGCLANMKLLSIEYRDFPIFRAPEVIINAVSLSLPVLLLAAFFGPATAGLYSLGRTVLGMPASLIGKSVGDVFYPRISQAANGGEALYPLVLKATLLLAVVGFVPFAVAGAIGPWLFGFVFGHEWVVAGDFARWLALMMFFIFINNPSISVIAVIKEQKFQLKYTLISVVARATSLYVAFLVYGTAMSTVATFSIVNAIINILLIAIILKKCRGFDLKRKETANTN